MDTAGSSGIAQPFAGAIQRLAPAGTDSARGAFLVCEDRLEAHDEELTALGTVVSSLTFTISTSSTGP